MKFITRESIEDWAERFESKGNLPTVVATLVIAITPYSTRSAFPSGSAVFVGGYDGIVNCDEATPYIPKGISLWEFGTEGSNNTKAETDYHKRTADSLT